MEATTEGCSLKYVFFKTRETRRTAYINIRTHHNDREDQHYYLSDVK